MGTTASSAAAAVPGTHEAPGARPLESISDLDLVRYSGRWFEVARLPNRWQPVIGSTHTVSVSYLAQLDAVSGHTVSAMEITQRDRNNDTGHVVELTGTVQPTNPPRGEFAIRFTPTIAAPYILPGTEVVQWVVEMDPDDAYSWVVVSEPKRRHLWVYSREIPMDVYALAGILERLVSVHGFTPEVLASLIFLAPPPPPPAAAPPLSLASGQ
jgi:apolipoprotein D and lipocalin family protein